MARLQQQTERFYVAFAELVRAYQFRDRENVCCHGLSVVQCYALEALRLGPMTMGQLAAHMYVDLSTMTRTVDQLVAGGLATRREDPEDRRVRRVQITRKGSALLDRIRAGLLDEYEMVMRAVPPDSRDAVVDAISHLLQAFKQRREEDSATPVAAGRSGCRR
ncbi:MAG: MarR family winged helix-turn-helix transcriptional regulator [Planctomycetota bacterium]|jgi:DNA-binding MarR family transcriptional regulator